VSPAPATACGARPPAGRATRWGPWQVPAGARAWRWRVRPPPARPPPPPASQPIPRARPPSAMRALSRRVLPILAGAAGHEVTVAPVASAAGAGEVARAADPRQVDAVAVCGCDEAFAEACAGLLRRPDWRAAAAALPLAHVPVARAPLAGAPGAVGAAAAAAAAAAGGGRAEGVRLARAVGLGGVLAATWALAKGAFAPRDVASVVQPPGARRFVLRSLEAGGGALVRGRAARRPPRVHVPATGPAGQPYRAAAQPRIPRAQQAQRPPVRAPVRLQTPLPCRAAKAAAPLMPRRTPQGILLNGWATVDAAWLSCAAEAAGLAPAGPAPAAPAAAGKGPAASGAGRAADAGPGPPLERAAPIAQLWGPALSASAAAAAAAAAAPGQRQARLAAPLAQHLPSGWCSRLQLRVHHLSFRLGRGGSGGGGGHGGPSSSSGGSATGGALPSPRWAGGAAAQGGGVARLRIVCAAEGRGIRGHLRAVRELWRPFSRGGGGGGGGERGGAWPPRAGGVHQVLLPVAITDEVGGALGRASRGGRRRRWNGLGGREECQESQVLG
jgi:hypothetical protein